jgi:hypothetical protein
MPTESIGEVLAMLRIVIGLVMAAHGIGHVIGVVGAVRPGGMTWGGSGTSWLLTPALGRATGAIEVVVFALPTVGFIVAAGLLLGGNEMWRGVAVAASVASFVAIGLFPQQLQSTSMVGAVAVNLVVLVGLLLLSWPSPEAVGA